MAYSKSPAVARQIESEMSPILSGQICSWEKHSEQEADRFAFRLRQARYIMLKHPTQFPRFARVIDKYRFEVRGSEVRGIPTATVVKQLPKVFEPTIETPVKPTVCIVNAPASIEQVIMAWINQGSKVGKLVATECSFSNQELHLLEEWAAMMSPELVCQQTGEKQIEIKVKP